ncbi:uncharacterized protein LOC130692781 [Daphnia carinata]|uniref:uncharacterized protein LOC130692781 n=1 Tax=Daphnia carinata TaxID=120202 RepID=UPI00258021CB|nr:uncharacterized protein LOC130692781 [Daphnia carinata]XP_059350513.1 uncharacterized protein LOC130692781 [Daphnia carinata]
MQVNRKLFAEKLKAFKGGPDQQPQNSPGFGLKVLESVEQRVLPSLSFKGIGEVSIPILLEDLVKLKSASEPVQNLKGLWEMNLQLDVIEMENSHFAKYLNHTIPVMTDLALRQLKFSREQVQGLSVRPRKLTIMEPGTGTIIYPTNNTPDVFATMIVQLPFQSGHEGGTIKVMRENQSCSFENALDSSRLFYYTIFVSNASCQMTEMSSGSRVMMIFDLLCANPSTLFPSTNYLKDVASILLELSPRGPDRLLAIPLDKDEVSFSSLAPGTRRLLDLFISMNFLHVRLALVCHYRMGKANQRLGCPCCLRRKCPCEEVVMVGISKEKISTTKWLDPLNQEMHFDNLNINMKTEIVGDGPIFFEKPTEELLQPGSCLLEQWFYRPMLVIWHKERSVQLDCFHRFEFLLDTLEQQTKKRVLCSLDEVITFCREHPGIAWKTENASTRLLKLCLRHGANDKVIRLLEILADTEGIHTEEMTDLLAKVISSVDWNACKSSIGKLISCNRAQEQMRHYSRLTRALLNIGNYQKATVVVTKICMILFTGNVMASLEIPVLADCIDLMVTFDENLVTKHPQRLANLATHVKKKFTSFVTVFELLSLVQQFLDARPSERIPDTAVLWYYRLCLHLTGLIIPSTPPEAILSALKLLVSSGDSTLSDALISQLKSKDNQENGVLRDFIGREAFWKFVEESTDHKKIAAPLVDSRIQWLIAIPKPIATWAVPNASVAGHPLVEEFMRSNERSMTYSNFNNIQHARNWRRKHYHEICHYAEIEVGGIGWRAYCEITKSRMRHVGNDIKAAICHKELMELIEQRLKRLGDTLYSIVKNEETNEICAVEALQSGEPIPGSELVWVKSAPVTAVLPHTPVTSNPVVLNGAGTQSVKLMSNGQFAVKTLTSAVQQVMAESSSTESCADTKTTVKKVTVITKSNPAMVLSRNQISQQAFPSLQSIKFPVEQKPNISGVKPLISTNASSPMSTPKRPRVAKRPFVVATLLQSNVNPSAAVPNPHEALHVKEESIASPAKRIKSDLV